MNRPQTQNLRQICALRYVELSICNQVAARERCQDTICYYTDGSVDPDTGNAAGAFDSRGVAVAYRLTDDASTLHAELGGILKALQHCLQYSQEQDNVICTDSMASVHFTPL